LTRCAVISLPVGGLWLVTAALLGCSHGSTSPEPPAAAPIEAVGDLTQRISPARVAELARTIDEIGYWQWQDQYLSEEDGCAAVATDHPGVDIEVRRGGATKHFSYYYGCKGLPVADQIDRLSKTIDDVAGTAALIGRE
jgi:hypothetical protein